MVSKREQRWRDERDRLHKADLKRREKEKELAFIRLKGAVELATIQQELNQQQKQRNSLMPNGTKNYSAANRGELAKLKDSATKDMWTLRNHANKFKADSAKLQQEYTVKLDEVPADQRAAAEKLYLGEYQRKLAKMREDQLEQRTELVASMKERAALAASARENLGNTVVAATLYGIGDERRSRIEQSLVNAGPAVIAAAGERARLTGDKMLAAAVFARNADIKKDQRPINSKAFADLHFGDEVEGVEDAVTAIELAAVQAAYADAEITGDTAKFDKLGFGLKFKGARLDPTEREEPEVQPNQHPNAKISRAINPPEED
ncbi:hypothetical protein [Aestuariivirga sp.]|uniref:hypothetical protein n=1 Tax=Aestuariivirga sp. TaxID=2650926 RepID=UPI003593BED5